MQIFYTLLLCKFTRCSVKNTEESPLLCKKKKHRTGTAVISNPTSRTCVGRPANTMSTNVGQFPTNIIRYLDMHRSAHSAIVHQIVYLSKILAGHPTYVCGLLGCLFFCIVLLLCSFYPCCVYWWDLYLMRCLPWCCAPLNIVMCYVATYL